MSTSVSPDASCFDPLIVISCETLSLGFDVLDASSSAAAGFAGKGGC